jgi:protoporphyrinogen oxidase
MVIQAAALIVAAPALYAERIFYTFVPEISQHLLDFHYDSITRVSLGYRQAEIVQPVEPPPDAGYAFDCWTDSEYRVPPGHVLVQVGLRYAPGDTPPETIIAELQKDMGWPDTHVVARVNHWPESHCLTVHDPTHDDTMTAIDALLPEGVALAGSDYRGFLIEDRVEQGIAAAQKIVTWLQT